MTNAFICHASRDHASAAALAPLLREKGYAVFLDRCDTRVPDIRWKHEVLEELDKADCVVALVGKGLDSPYVFFELTYSRIRARTRGMPVLAPVIVDDEYYAGSELIPRLGSLGLQECVERVHSLMANRGRSSPHLVSPRDPFIASLVEAGTFPAKAGDALAELILDDRLPITGEFVAASSYPYARLINQLPYELADELTDRLLIRSSDADVVRHALHLYGLIHTSTPGRSNDALLRLSSEITPALTERFGGRDGGVLRQLDFATAQLGSEEARDRFMKILDTDEGKTFDSSFINHYYDGDTTKIGQRFNRARRPDEVFLTPVLDRIHELVLQARQQHREILRRTPVVWPHA